jgi:cytochrome c553
MLYRLIFAVAAVAAILLGNAACAADLEAGKMKAEPCGACHGAEGVSEVEGVPSLAGQPDQFLQWQLVYFRSGTRKDEVMEPLAAELSDAEIRDFGAYYASLPAPQPGQQQGQQADERPALKAQGSKLAAQHNCSSCHKDDFSGQQATARIANQREDYLVKALRDFKTGERTGGGVAAMPSAAYRLSEEDMPALAYYLARFP